MDTILDLNSLLKEAKEKASQRKAEKKSNKRAWAAGTTPENNPLGLHRFSWIPTHQVLIMQRSTCQCCGSIREVSRGFLIREELRRKTGNSVRMRQFPCKDWRALPKMIRWMTEAEIYGCRMCFETDEHFPEHERIPLDPEVLLGTDEEQKKIDKILDGLGVATPKDDLRDKGDRESRRYDNDEE